jgi:aminomethyltransferase
MKVESVEESGRDHIGAEGAKRENSQAKGPDLDDTSERERSTEDAIRKENLSGTRNEGAHYLCAFFDERSNMEKKTPLYDLHVELKGNIVPFAGYLLPVNYPDGILHEHRLVRSKAGLFDVSHMGELILEGPDALANLQYLVTNDYRNLEIGSVRYGVLVKEDGTAVDDLLVYKMQEEKYFIVVNASNTDKDDAWIRAHLFGDVTLKNVSDGIGEIALQGPLAKEILSKICVDLPGKYYTFKDYVDVAGISCLVSATGYTGEAGYEIYCKAKETQQLFRAVLAAGKEEGLQACGLGCRDTLRLEAAMPLYGHELSEEITPVESGLKSFVKLDKERFIAQDALSQAPKRRRIGLELTDRGIAREHTPVWVEGKEVGFVTSGTMSPTLGKAIAMAIVDIDAIDAPVFQLDVRGRILAAKRTPLPFYKRK